MTQNEKPSNSSKAKTHPTEQALADQQKQIGAWLRASAAEQLGIAAQKSLNNIDHRDDATAAHVMMMLAFAVEQGRYVPQT